MTAKAFTLIELLIVVAIIAILAAIALPNMLEAQMRAKVSRAHADMRTIATALELYRTDTNRYPPHYDTPQDFNVLSTPVAYLTAIPREPFASHRNPNYALNGPFYTYQDLLTLYPSWGGGNWLARRKSEGKMWSLSSVGPDFVESINDDATLIYDPSNGTVSRGDIVRLGP